MAIQMQSRPRFSRFGDERKWTPEDQTNRTTITQGMRRLANELRRDEREVRFVEDKTEWL